MQCFLAWYEQKGDDFVGRTLLRDVDEDTVRIRFHLLPHQSAVDCCPVGARHVDWLNAVSGLSLDLERFDYFVECGAE